MRITFNPAAAIYETVEDDIIIINLKNGNYYNLTESAATLWPAICRSVSVEAASDALAGHYQQDVERVRGDLMKFVDDLEKEDLISVDHDNTTDSDCNLHGANGNEYVAPGLNTFSDMQDFLLVDPVHEVDENGLPRYTNQAD